MCLVVNLLSRISRSNVHFAVLSCGLGALRAGRRTRDVILRARIELWRVQNRRETCPSELSASFFETLEVSGTPRGHQESFKQVSKSSKVTIHRACGVLRSCQDAAGSPRRGPKELFERQREVQNSPEELHRSSEERSKLI